MRGIPPHFLPLQGTLRFPDHDWVCPESVCKDALAGEEVAQPTNGRGSLGPSPGFLTNFGQTSGLETERLGTSYSVSQMCVVPSLPYKAQV